MRYEVFLGIFIITILVILFIYNNFWVENKQGRVCFNDKCFNVNLAITPAEQTKGLMFVNHLDEDKGMLFIFQADGVYPFWMKNMLIPLDIIWIGSDGNVVYINRNTQPCTSTCPNINPGKEARYVLEVNAGIADKIGLEVGGKITIVRT